MMTFDNNNPNPGPRFINHLLDNHPDLHKLNHIDMVAHHIPYKKEEFAKVMPSDTVFVSSLREPVSHFKSIMNFYKVWEVILRRMLNVCHWGTSVHLSF